MCPLSLFLSFSLAFSGTDHTHVYFSSLAVSFSAEIYLRSMCTITYHFLILLLRITACIHFPVLCAFFLSSFLPLLSLSCVVSSGLLGCMFDVRSSIHRCHTFFSFFLLLDFSFMYSGCIFCLPPFLFLLFSFFFPLFSFRFIPHFLLHFVPHCCAPLCRFHLRWFLPRVSLFSPSVVLDFTLLLLSRCLCAHSCLMLIFFSFF